MYLCELTFGPFSQWAHESAVSSFSFAFAFQIICLIPKSCGNEIRLMRVILFTCPPGHMQKLYTRRAPPLTLAASE